MSVGAIKSTRFRNQCHFDYHLYYLFLWAWTNLFSLDISFLICKMWIIDTLLDFYED